MVIVVVLVVILGGVVYQNLMVSTPPIEPPDNTNTTETPPEEPPPQNTTQPTHQEYRVTDIIIDQPLVPSGVPLGITVRLEKISGEDPFPVTLSISGTPYETRDIAFGESNQAEVHFKVTSTRQGRYEAHVLGVREEFEVRVMPVNVEWITVTPWDAEPNREITVNFGARNPNNVSVSDQVWVEVIPDNFFVPVQLGPLAVETFNFTLQREYPGNYSLRVAGKEVDFIIKDTQPFIPEGEKFVWTPINWVPDPATWNMTAILPPEASPVRLSLPIPIDSLYGKRWAGIGGMGLHAGGHIEGLDHVWIESTSTEPVKSWANGTNQWVQLSGDVEHGEYHIGIDYGQNLLGVHMEIETPFVEVGDYVERGEPVGIGMSYFEDIQSAEFSLIDRGRSDGIYSGDGVYVSPFDYLVEPEKIALAQAYIENIIEPYVETGVFNGMFEPDQPYFTNNLLIHRGHEGKLQGEWYLISQNWTTGYPNDMITIIEADNPYYKGAKILGMDDESMGGVDNWNFKSELIIDYENSRIQWTGWTGHKFYGIFEVDESEERAKLLIQYQTGGYPTEFTEDALTYIERTYIPRRMDGVSLGVLPSG